MPGVSTRRGNSAMMSPMALDPLARIHLARYDTVCLMNSFTWLCGQMLACSHWAISMARSAVTVSSMGVRDINSHFCHILLCCELLRFYFSCHLTHFTSCSRISNSETPWPRMSDVVFLIAITGVNATDSYPHLGVGVTFTWQNGQNDALWTLRYLMLVLRNGRWCWGTGAPP